MALKSMEGSRIQPMSKTLFLCGSTHGQQLATFSGAGKFRKALMILLAKGVGAVLEEWDHYGNIVVKSSTQMVCEAQGIYWEELGLPNDAPTFGDTLFDPPIPAEFDTARIVPLPENLPDFLLGRPSPEFKAWDKVTEQNSTLIVGRYRLDHHIKREDHMFVQIQSQLAKRDHVLAIVGVAHMGSLLRKCKESNLNVEGFLFTFCETCSPQLPKK
jgi:hypothetical protein